MSAPMLTGLSWGAIAARLEGAPAETRARVIYLLEGIEAGALTAHAAMAREAGEQR